jgi:hypothetical protein
MHNLTRKFLPFSSVLLFAISMAWTPATAAAQSASFAISQHGKSVGTASFSLTSSGNGYNSTSVLHVSMQGLEYALSKTERLNSAHHLRNAHLSATINGQAVTVAAEPASSQPASSRTATQIQLTTSANGRKSSTSLALHSGAVFLPDFDPGALETLLSLAASRNNRDLWAILPKKTGLIESIVLATYADQKGTLDGKPVEVHHLVATIGNSTIDLFSNAANQLLQAEYSQQGFALVRKGFVLTPSSKPQASTQAQ